jgi:hypothetical protein
MDEKQPKKRGPKGGIKHDPGRGHRRKSGRPKKRRFARKAAKKHQTKEEESRKEWAEWDQLRDEVKRLLGPAGQPRTPRPRDEH